MGVVFKLDSRAHGVVLGCAMVWSAYLPTYQRISNILWGYACWRNDTSRVVDGAWLDRHPLLLSPAANLQQRAVACFEGTYRYHETLAKAQTTKQPSRYAALWCAQTVRMWIPHHFFSQVNMFNNPPSRVFRVHIHIRNDSLV